MQYVVFGSFSSILLMCFPSTKLSVHVDQERSNTLAIVLGIVLPLAAVVILLISVAVIFICRKPKVVNYKKTGTYQPETLPCECLSLSHIVGEPDVEMDSLKLKLIPSKKVEICEVHQSCELRDLITKWKPQVKSWRGCIFYELTEKEEYISKDKNLIFQEMV